MSTDSLSKQRYGLAGSGLSGEKKTVPISPRWRAFMNVETFTKEAQTIADAIESKVVGQYGIWRVGLTHDLAKRRLEWGKTEMCTHWTCWQAASLTDAQAIERHFINKGMKGGTGGDLSAYKPIYVYVF